MPKKIGVVLAEFRAQLGKTQVQIAEQLNVSQSWVSEIEHSGDELTISTIKRYCKVIRKNIVDVLTASQ